MSAAHGYCVPLCQVLCPVLQRQLLGAQSDWLYRNAYCRARRAAGSTLHWQHSGWNWEPPPEPSSLSDASARPIHSTTYPSPSPRPAPIQAKLSFQPMGTVCFPLCSSDPLYPQEPKHNDVMWHPHTSRLRPLQSKLNTDSYPRKSLSASPTWSFAFLPLLHLPDGLGFSTSHSVAVPSLFPPHGLCMMASLALTTSGTALSTGCKLTLLSLRNVFPDHQLRAVPGHITMFYLSSHFYSGQHPQCVLVSPPLECQPQQSEEGACLVPVVPRARYSARHTCAGAESLGLEWMMAE